MLKKANPVVKSLADHFVPFLPVPPPTSKESGDSIYFYPLKNKNQPQQKMNFNISHHCQHRDLTNKINEQQTKKHWRKVKSI